MQQSVTPRLGCAGLLLAVCTPALAIDFIDSLDGKFDASDYLAENAFGFLPIPVIITEPAVDGGLGMAGLFFHEDDETAARRKEMMKTTENPGRFLLPPSTSAAFGAYTGNGSWIVGAGHMGFYREGSIRYRGNIGYGDIQLDYYSIDNVDLDNPVTIDTEALFLGNTLLFRIADWPFYIGPRQQLIDASLSADSLGDLLPPDTPPEEEEELLNQLRSDVTTSGLGFVAEFDNRDNVFTPIQGFYYRFDYLAFRDAIGSDIDYDNYILSGLNYFKFSDQWRLALRLEGEIADSDEPLPPFAQPALDMRGIPAARYQGSYVGLLEGELTWQVTPRWGLLAFSGAGKTSDSASDFADSESYTTLGAGFRYKIARRYGFHMGIDVARGPEDTIFYIQAGSAW